MRKENKNMSEIIVKGKGNKVKGDTINNSTVNSDNINNISNSIISNGPVNYEHIEGDKISITKNGPQFEPCFVIKDHTKETASICSAIIAIALIVIFISSNSLGKRIVGTWQKDGSDKLYEFTKDGQFIYLSGNNSGATITYSIDGNQIKLNINIAWGHATVIADIDIQNDMLTLSNFVDPDDVFGASSDDTWIFHRVK